MRERIVVGVVSLIGITVAGLVVLLMRVSPVQIRLQTFTFQLNETLPDTPETYVKANEKVLKECKVVLDGVDSSIIAVYPAYVEYQGKRYEFQIMIEDKKVPVITLKDKKSVIKCFSGATYRAADLVNVEDDTQTEIYFMDTSDGNQYEEITFEKSGSYDYFIYAEDTSNNLSRVRIRFEVELDNTSPVLTGVTPKTLKVGEDFDPMEGVKAMDNADGDLTAKIEIYGDVDTNTAGQYYLTYCVTDASGNKTSEERLITVTESGVAGQADVCDGSFLTADQISMRDSLVTTLLENELDYFDDETFIRELNHYLVTHFNPSNNTGDETSYSVIVKQRGNRAGMARAVKIFLDQKEIENWIVFGDNDGMVWNIVKVNGSYRHLDVYANAIGAEEYICLLVTTGELDKAYSYPQSEYPNCD